MKVELLARLRNHEDNFTERKLDGTPARDLRKTIVAFANSVPEGRSAVLFIGVANDGTPVGVKNADELEKTIRQVCKSDCYPPVEFTCETGDVDSKAILAVEIPSSTDKPHFSGPAFVREGSESVAASKEMFEELIRSRIDVCRVIQRAKGQVWRVVGVGKRLGTIGPVGDPKHTEACDCTIIECNAHYIRFQQVGVGRLFNEQTRMATISYDEVNHKPMIIVRWP